MVKGSFERVFFQNKWPLHCLCAPLNNDIITSVFQLLSESLLHQQDLRLHKWPSLPHLTPTPWKHLNWDLSASVFSLVSLVFFTESELLFIDIGMLGKPASIISFSASPWQQPVFQGPTKKRGVILQTRNGWLWHTLTSCGWSACQNSGVDLSAAWITNE